MKSFLVRAPHYFLAGILSIILFSCSPAQPSIDPNLIWAVNLTRFEMKEELEIIETVTQYDQTVDELHQQFPDEGNVYLIMKLIVTKQGADSTPFDWSKLIVQDETGNSYKRHDNDSFLEQYAYTPRMTGLEIKFGENEGWVCYELPDQAVGGKLTLIYNAEGSQQEIVVKK